MSVKRASEVGTREGFCKLLVSLTRGMSEADELLEYLKDVPIDQIGEKYDVNIARPRPDILEIQIPANFRSPGDASRIVLELPSETYNVNFNIKEVDK